LSHDEILVLAQEELLKPGYLSCNIELSSFLQGGFDDEWGIFAVLVFMQPSTSQR